MHPGVFFYHNLCRKLILKELARTGNTDIIPYVDVILNQLLSLSEQKGQLEFAAQQGLNIFAINLGAPYRLELYDIGKF